MAEKEIEIENVDETATNFDANLDADALIQAEAEAEAETAQAVESTADAQAAPKTPAPVAEKPKTSRQRSDELFNRVLMGRDKELNNLLNKWGKDKFFKLINENKDNFRKDFYSDISNRGIKIPIDEYNGYYTPTYERQKQVVYSDEGLKQIRAEEQQKQKEKRQAAAEAAAEKNKPWYQAIPDMLGTGTKAAVDFVKKGLDIITETTGKSKILEPLGVNKFVDYLKDNITSTQRGASFGEAINETNIPALAMGSVDMDFNRIAKQMKDLKEYGATNIERDFQNHEGGWDTVSDYAKMIIPTILESGSTLIRSGWEETLASSIAGAPAVGGIMAAYHMELFASIVDELEQAKDKDGNALYDVTNGEDWRRAFNDRAFIEPILKKANTRAAIITGFDMLGAGVFGNVASGGLRLVKKAEKVLPKTLTSPIARGLSKIGQSKKVFTHPAVQQLTTKLGQIAQTKVGKAVTKVGAKVGEYADPKEIATALGGEATAQYVTTGKIDPESTAMEGTGEISAIKLIARLLGKGRSVFGSSSSPTTPTAPAAPGVPPAPGAPSVSTDGVDEYGAVVTDEEYAAYKKDKTLDPERRAAIEDDAKKALDDPKHLEYLKEDIDTDESLRRYFEMVTDAMEQETKLREGEEIMKASIAHVAEVNGGIGEKEMMELIDPSSPRFNKDIAGMVERKYQELADAYATETGDESFRQKPAASTTTAAAPVTTTATTQQTGAQTQAAETEKLSPEIKKGLAAIQKLEDYVSRIDANLSGIDDTPANQAEIQKILASKKVVLEEIERNKQALKQQGYDIDNPSGVAATTEVATETVAPGEEVVTEEVVDETPVISPEIRALAAKELDPKKLLKDGSLVYKNRKPVYNGKEFKNTKELQAFLQTDEGILAAAETNEAIANALGKTPTFTGTTETGVEGATATSQTGPATEPVAGTQTAEGAAAATSVEPATQETESTEVQTEGLDKNTKEKLKYLQDAKAKMEQRIKDNPDSPDMPKFQKALNAFNRDLDELKKEIAKRAAEKEKQPEGRPRVKGDGQEVVEAFEKAIAAGKKISFPVSGGRTTVLLDKPGQLKVDENGNLYIPNRNGSRDYLPAGGGEESVIREQLGVAETAESKKQRNDAIAERNKKAKEKEDQKRKAEEEKQAQQRREMIDRLQRILDTGKNEKGKTISEKERKEVQKNIDKLKQSIADAEAADKLVKGEEPTTKPEAKPAETEKQPEGMPKDIQEAYGKRANLRMIADALQKQMKGKPLIGKSAKELANVEAEIAALDRKIDAYEKSKEAKPEAKPEPKQETKPEAAPEQTKLEGGTKEENAYGNFLLDKIMAKDFPYKATLAEFVKQWNSIAKDRDASRANNSFEEILVGIAPAKEKPLVISGLRDEFKNQSETKPAAETETPKTKAQEKLQNAIDGAKRSTKGTPLTPDSPGSAKIGDIFNAGYRLIVTGSLLADNFDRKIADNDGDGVEVYERVSKYGEMENGKLSKAPEVRIMIFNNKADADAYFKEREAKNQERIKQLQEEVDNEGKPEKPAAETETVTEETVTEAEPEALEQYVPLTSKNIEIGKFSKDEAVDYETDEKELGSGRMSEYISSMTVEVLNDDGNTVGFLTKLKDEDGTVTWQSSNESGDELGIDEAFDTKQEAIQALLDDYNKEQSKEFAKEQKRLAKEAEKKKAKTEKAAPTVVVEEESTTVTPEAETRNQMQMMDDIMETERTKPAAAKEMRDQFVEQHGKEVFDKLNKITRNFEKIINTLEKEGKCTKKC